MHFIPCDTLVPLSPWRWGGLQASFTGCSGGPWGRVILLHGPEVAPYWPPASRLPHLLVDLDSWLPQVFQAEPLHVKHHQHRLNLPAQLHGTGQ